MIMMDIGSFHCPDPRAGWVGGYCLYPEIMILLMFYCTDTINLFAIVKIWVLTVDN